MPLGGAQTLPEGLVMSGAFGKGQLSSPQGSGADSKVPTVNGPPRSPPDP